MQAEGATPLVEQAEQQERGPRQRGVPRRQVLAEGRHGTGRASEPRDRGRAGNNLSAGTAGETGRIARRRERAGPAARERPLARAAAPSPPWTLASRTRARARGDRKVLPQRDALRTRGPPLTRRKRGGPRGAGPRRGSGATPASALGALLAHTLAFTRTGRAGQACAADLVGPAPLPSPS